MIRSAPDPSGVRIVVSGRVDRATAETVADAVRRGLECATRVEVDLRRVDRWEGGALSGMAACTRLGEGVELIVEGRRELPKRSPERSG